MTTQEPVDTSPSDSASREDQLPNENCHHAIAKDGSKGPHEGAESGPEYARGLRLSIIMCTINLTTMIAALDLVRVLFQACRPERDLRLTRLCFSRAL
jgi:hypothetical protein